MTARRYAASLLPAIAAGCVFFSAPVCAGGAKPAPAKAPKQAAKDTGKSAATLASNAATTASVKTALLADKVAPGMAINVDTNKGVVTLSGQVDSKQQAQRAEEVAKKTKGVKKVINKLTVKGAATAKHPAKK